VGLGVQGKKRKDIAADHVVATVDPEKKEADYKSVFDVELNSFDNALCCIPDQPKFEVLTYLLGAGKNVLVEKPLWVEKRDQLLALERLANKNKSQCYTAYNHRFEPHFVKMNELIRSGKLGKIYRVRFFYGNGTAQLVKGSSWRDQGAGVLPDLSSHLLDTIRYWFGDIETSFELVSCSCFENNAPDHVIINSEAGPTKFELEVTLLNWKNHFTCDVLAEKGSAHIQSLCKWGPATLSIRNRKYPSGIPDENMITLTEPDPTWRIEYDEFIHLCQKRAPVDLTNDIWLHDNIMGLSERAISWVN
jgi:predicted dehydrogenase